MLGGLLLVLLEGSLQRQLAGYLRTRRPPVLERELGARRRRRRLGRGSRPASPSRRRPGARRRSIRPGRRTRLRDLAAVLIRELSGRDIGIVVYDLRRRVVAASEPGGRIERWPVAPPDALERAAVGSETQRVVRQGTRRTLLLLLPLQRPNGEVFGILEVATSLELVDTLWTQIAVALAVGTLLAVLVAGGLAGWVTRAALGPLDRMVRVTRRVAGGDLSARVELKREDEVGELGAAFDQMVGRLEAAFAMQRRLVSDAAHELRTPLNGLAGTLEIVQVGLARGDLDGRQPAAVGRRGGAGPDGAAGERPADALQPRRALAGRDVGGRAGAGPARRRAARPHPGAGPRDRGAAGRGGPRPRQPRSAGARRDQPARQRRQVHAGRRADRGRGAAGRRRGPGDGPRHRARHPAGRPAAHLRPVLPGGPGALAPGGRDRAGAGDRAGDRPGARRADRGREHGRRRHDDPGLAARRRRTVAACELDAMPRS